MRSLKLLLLPFCLLSAMALAQPPKSGEAKPATAAQAAAALDLSTFPLVDPSGEPNHRVIASQSYAAKGAIADVTKKLRAQLIAAGLKELEGAMITTGYVSVNFQKAGFTFSLNITPGSESETCSVNLFNFSNVNLKQLPKLPKTTELYALPNMIAYVVEGNAETTSSAYRSLLEKNGWSRFGDTTASFFVKQNAVRLQVTVSDKPGEAGKTIVQISSEQLSADLPAPPDCEWLQYTDPTGGMMFDTKRTQAELISFFTTELGKSQWRPTTDNTVRIDFRDHLIFRNPKMEMIELQFYEVEKKTRCDLKYKTAAQMIEENKKADALMAELKKKREAETEAMKNPPKVALQSPKSAAVKSQDAKSAEFTTESGAARGIVSAWMKEQEANGWKKSVTIDTKEAGEFTLTKDKVELSVSYIDPGFIAGSITLQLRGNYKLDLTK